MKWKKAILLLMVSLLCLGTGGSGSSYALSINGTVTKISSLDESTQEILRDPVLNLTTETDEYKPDVSVPSVSDNVYGPDHNQQLPAAAGDNVLMMIPGQSYAFTNNGSASRSLSMDASTAKGITFDYVVYKSDGTISTDGMDSAGSVLVQSGSTAVVTSSGVNPMNVTVRPEFTYVTSSNPALHRVTLSLGNSYRFVNEGSQARSLMSDGSTAQDRLYDYAVYKEDGVLSSSNFNTAGKPSVASGGEVILTGTSVTPVTVGLPYEPFSGEWSSEPAYIRITLNHGESYQFTNISTKSDTIQSDGSTKDKFDYVVYLPDGTESSRGSNTSTEPTILAGRTVVITQVTETPVTFGVPYRTFDAQRAGGDAISRITVQPGESVIFRNNGSLANPIKNDASSSNGGVFDYVMYTSEGVYYSDGFNKNSDPMIRSYGYAVVTVAGNVPIVFDYTDDFSVENSPEPAYHRIMLNKGESVTFVNRSGETEWLDSDASTSKGRLFDYVTYYPDGTERSTGKATATEPSVYSGNKAVVTGASDVPVVMGAIYTLFDVEGRPNEAISKITVSPGQSVVFRNGGSLANPIKNDASKVGGIYDYVMYKADGSAYTDRFNQSSTSPNVPKGGEAVVTVVGSQPIVFDYTDEFTVEDSAEPAYLRVMLNKGESYAYTNISNVAESLDSNASTSQQRLFDVVTYYEDGTERSRHTSTATNPMVFPGNKAVVTVVSDNPVMFGGIYRVFRGQDDSGEQTTRTTIQPGQSYLFQNTVAVTSQIQSPGSENNLFDFATYRTNGSLITEGFGVSSSPNIPADTQTIVTNISAAAITFEHLDTITAQPSVEPAFHRITLGKGLSYQFKNISSQNKVLESDASASASMLFDYVTFKPDGTERAHGTSTSNEPTVVAGDRAIVTTVTDNSVTFGAVYRLFEAIPADVSPDLEVTVRQEQSYVFVNPGNAESVLSSDGSEKGRSYDVAVYGGANQPVMAEEDSSRVIVNLPAESTTVITVTSAEPVTFHFKKPVTAQPSTEPALVKQSLEPEESVAFHNKISYTAPLLSDASQGRGTFYDFTVLDRNKNILSQGEHVVEGQSVPAEADIELFNTSTGTIAFAGPYRSFTIQEIAVEFLTLIETVEAPVPARINQAVYYRFMSSSSGTYRFAVKESGAASEKAQLVLYDDKKLSQELASSTKMEQYYGDEYTVLEWELQAGRYYYLKLDERDGKALNAVIKAAGMSIQNNTRYEYGAANRLLKTILYTGDQIVFEYDKNGNLTKRTKKVFPY